ncbi:hypothetical protein CesoFtcFv8_012142 [Champsocephalus esox]|uniref:Cadherin Y-type LIR-motif domain-containing protein n=1 Tax=Champsocephalus esox TaxID=159716 RepID=A0AAN8BUV6_9TELE|nr:hypothetical protein CesoFtcFv8_012142 [Champsocephalus esox]
MCLLVFFAVLVAVTVWNQKGSRNKFRKRGVYHIPAEHESWEDIRENILNYNEEGGGEQDQNGYDISELKRPLGSSLSQSSSGPLIKSSSQEEVHPSGSSSSSGAPYLSIPHHPHPHHHHHHPPPYQHAAYSDFAPPTFAPSCSHGDFQSYVARILWEADSDGGALPPDALHLWSVEGSGSGAGSLSSLGSRAGSRREEEKEEEGGFADERLSRWGPKFQALSEMYDRPQLGLAHRDAVTHIQRGHSRDPLPLHH